MQTRVTISANFDSIGHKWFPADERCHAFGTLCLGDTEVHLYTPADIDRIIAKLAALRAEMTGWEACPSVAPHSGRRCTVTGAHDVHRNGMVVWGPGITEGTDDAWRLTPKGEAALAGAGAPHHAARYDETQCRAENNPYTCTAQAGHDGPEHIAYGIHGEVCHTWPVGEAAPGPDEGSEVAWSDEAAAVAS